MEKVLLLSPSTQPLRGTSAMVQSMYCVKCKKKVNVEDSAVTKEKTSKGKPMLRAKCPGCGTKMAKFTK